MATPNAALAYKVLDHIDAHPESWNQLTWWCGTGGCFAGWAVELSGITIPPSHMVDGLHIADRAVQLLGFENEGELNRATREALGIDEDEDDPPELFGGGNNRGDLGCIVEAVFGPRPCPNCAPGYDCERGNYATTDGAS